MAVALGTRFVPLPVAGQWVLLGSTTTFMWLQALGGPVQLAWFPDGQTPAAGSNGLFIYEGQPPFWLECSPPGSYFAMSPTGVGGVKCMVTA
jgi:hypothetical protein